jgi:Domain of unknown function (DUF4062)
MSNVYVSSTFQDLQSCRKEINAAIRKLNHVDISMENYTAVSMPTVTKCLSDVARSDIYIGVFAKRYGWIPIGQNISITELELSEAINKNKDILVFLLDDNAKDWPQIDDESVDSKKKLAELINKLKGGTFMFSYFSTCHDLVVNVIASLANLLYPVTIPIDYERENKLLGLLNNNDLITQSRAKEELIAMGSTRFAAKLLLELDKSELNDQQLLNNLESLTRIGNQGGSIMPLLQSLLKNANPLIRAWVIAAIGKEGNAGKQIDIDTVNSILNLYKDSSANVRKEVAHAIYKLPYNPEIKEKMIVCLSKLGRDEDQNVVETAMYSQWKLGKTYLDTMPNLKTH